MEQPPKTVMTVLGPVPAQTLGIADAHNHLWIDPAPGTPPDLPRLVDRTAILSELKEYRQAGGRTQVDCQPGGSGRDGRVLQELSRQSGVHIVASTGFHLAKYYPSDFWLFEAAAEQAQAFFVSEILYSLQETREQPDPVRAGFIKIACPAQLEDLPEDLLIAAASAALETGTAMEIHTERGSAAEEIFAFFSDCGVPPQRLVICHMDKRPDFGLHRELVQAGVTLEYDTFYRPKYEPEAHLWPLLRRMVEAGLGSQVALATDMAEADLWAYRGGPGLAGLLTRIQPRLERLEIDQITIQGLLGGNIARCLAI